MSTIPATTVEQQHRPGAPAEAPWRGALRLVAPAALLTLIAPALLLDPGDAQRAPAVAAAVSSVHSLLAFGAAYALGRPALGMEGRHRTAWSLIAVGTALWGVSNTAWLVGYAIGVNPDAARSIPAFTITNSVLLAGAVLMPSSARRMARIRRLDTAIMMVAAVSVLWALPLVPLITDSADQQHRLIYGALSAVKVLTVVVAMGTFVRCRPDERDEIPPLAFALILLGVADVLFVSSERVGYPLSARLADAIFTATLLLLLIAGRRIAGPVPAAATRSRRRLLGPALPELCTVVALVVIAVDRLVDHDDGFGVSVVLAGLLVLLAIVRLGLLEHEQRQLMASRRRSAELMYEEARVDALTGLGNRLALDERLTHAARRRSGGPVSVFFIDVDHFKRYNDGLGHHAGDRLLVEVARRLRDLLGEDGVYRVGGDEFVAVRADLDRPSLEELAGDVVAIAAEPVELDGRELNCTVSVGVAQLDPSQALERRADRSGQDGAAPSPREFSDRLLRRADLALYCAKERGRDQWAAYEPALQHRADQRIHRQQQLHQGLVEGRLEVHHQPVVHLPTGRTIGLAAALRWRSPDHGLLRPDAFLSDVIDGGLLPQIGTLLFDQIGGALRRADEAGTDIRWIATALRREEIVHPGLVECVRDALGPHRIDLGRVRIVVAEDTVVDQAALDVVEELRSIGLQVAVHRFGTGRSSLLSLGRYPASTITLDESFVEGLGRRRDDTAIVHAVAGLTADLGLEMGAEGIAEEAQAMLLTSLGCALGQGRHFGEHAPLEQVLDGLTPGRSTATAPTVDA